MGKVQSGLLITLVSCTLLFNNGGRANAQAAVKPMISPVEETELNYLTPHPHYLTPHPNGSNFENQFIDYLKRIGFVDFLQKGIDGVGGTREKVRDSVLRFFSDHIPRISKQKSSQQNLEESNPDNNSQDSLDTDSKNAQGCAFIYKIRTSPFKVNVCTIEKSCF